MECCLSNIYSEWAQNTLVGSLITQLSNGFITNDEQRPYRNIDEKHMISVLFAQNPGAMPYLDK